MALLLNCCYVWLNTERHLYLNIKFPIFCCLIVEFRIEESLFKSLKEQICYFMVRDCVGDWITVEL